MFVLVGGRERGREEETNIEVGKNDGKREREGEGCNDNTLWHVCLKVWTSLEHYGTMAQCSKEKLKISFYRIQMNWIKAMFAVIS